MGKFGTRSRDFFKRETVFCIAAVLAVFSSCLVPPDREYINYIDFKTLALLFGLMAIVAGMQSIGVFTALGQKLLQGSRGTRKLSLILVCVCFFCSMVITNDVALITFVPFTILVYSMAGREEYLIRLIVLETIAANLGSMATPIGNPQNLYLYSVSGLSIFEFLQAVLPYTGISLILLIGVLLSGRDEPIHMEVRMSGLPEECRKSAGKLFLYLVLFTLNILVVLHVLPWQAAFAVTFFYMCLRDRKVMGGLDYFLLLTFVCFFIFIGNIKRIEGIRFFLEQVISGHELLTGIAASQVISNVPAAILLSGFTKQYQTLLTAVNLGGLGTLIASLASLISYKFFVKSFETQKGAYVAAFTKWNSLFLIVLTFFWYILKFINF